VEKTPSFLRKQEEELMSTTTAYIAVFSKIRIIHHVGFEEIQEVRISRRR
jgi:hypothetical protein